MKNMALVLLFGWSVSFAHTATPDLSIAKLGGFEKTDSPVWVHSQKKNYAVTATVLDNAWFDLTETGVSAYLEKMGTTRGTVNFFAGITEWQINDHSFKKENNEAVLIIHGKFRQGQQDTFFTEMQTFKAPHIYQIKVSSRDPEDLSDSGSEKIFKAFADLIP